MCAFRQNKLLDINKEVKGHKIGRVMKKKKREKKVTDLNLSLIKN